MNLNRRGMGFLLLGLVLLSGSPARAATDLMIALGDSITAGTMADSNPPTAGLRSGREDTGSESKRALSWATGDLVPSHFLKLKSWMAAHAPEDKLEALNLAVAGAVATGLQSQIQEAQKALSSGAYRQLKYVTLLIGANDACVGTPPADFRKQLTDTLIQISKLDPKNPPHVLVVSLPQIPLLARKEIAQARTYLGMTCETFRKTLGLCQSMLNWKTEEELKARLDRVAELNAAIRDSIESARLFSPAMEIAYAGSFAEAELKLEGMAADCFHPNKSGQKELADAFWASQPWFQ